MINSNLFFNKNLSKRLKEIDHHTLIFTGATSGFISTIIKIILNKCYELDLDISIIAIIRNQNKANLIFKNFINNQNLIFMKHDVNNKYKYDNFKNIENVYAIINGAAMVSPKNYTRYPYETVLTNIQGQINTLELCKHFAKTQKNSPIFFSISSSSVYGKSRKIEKITENDYGFCNPLSQRSFYAETKRVQETLALAFSLECNIPIKIGRFSNLYGRYMPIYNGQSLSDFVGNAEENIDIIIKSDGLAKREYLHFIDASFAFLYILFFGKNSTPYNIGSNQLISIKQIAEFVLTANKIVNQKLLSIKILNNEISHNNINKLDSCKLDISQLFSIGWIPKIAFLDGLVDYFEWRKNE
jgi:nucleoside-diphosphate-sugar epimerase